MMFLLLEKYEAFEPTDCVFFGKSVMVISEYTFSKVIAARETSSFSVFLFTDWWPWLSLVLHPHQNTRSITRTIISKITFQKTWNGLHIFNTPD
jgi:hypothetical protein